MHPNCLLVDAMFQRTPPPEPPVWKKTPLRRMRAVARGADSSRCGPVIGLAILLAVSQWTAAATVAESDNQLGGAFASLSRARQDKQTAGELLRRLEQQRLPFQLIYLEHGDGRPQSEPAGRETRHLALGGQPSGNGSQPTTATRSNQVVGHYNRTNVVIKAFNYKFRLDLELNNNLFGPSLIQKHFLPKGQQISTQRLEHCYYHARSQLDTRPLAIGAFRTCNGLSGIIHANNESFVIHPFYDADLSKKHPHIIYRYQTIGAAAFNPSGPDYEEPAGPEQPPGSKSRECGNTRLHEWALRQYNKLAPEQPAIGRRAAGHAHCDSCHEEEEPRLSKRDVSLTEKYIELALILSQDVFEKRNSSSRLEVLHDAIQIVNLLDLYFRSANTRVALIYIETWQHGDQIELSSDVKQTLYNFLEYSTRKLYKVSMDAVHLLTGGLRSPFDSNQVGMAIPDSICSSRAVSVSQEASLFEPFIAASTMAHMLGHNLGMEHDSPPAAGVAPVEQAAPASQRGRPTEVPARQRPAPSAPTPAQSHTGEGEEHEDEVRSRSVGQEQRNWAEVAGIGRAPASCRWNCIMSERFTYPQPPVSIGNMIQQPQVASSGPANTTGHLVSVFHGTDTGHHQQQAEPVNGPTMSQIDDELQMLAKESQLLASLPFRFSQQSVDTFHRQLRLGHGICLFNKPNQLEDFKTCGNGIVDKGEDCDCGTFQECLESDSCCDPITCKFKADAECINGACCDRCRLRKRGFVCRRARGECDLSEQCDGKSGQCAPDVYKANGQPCAAGQGHCFQGRCPTHDQQCADLWGSDARQSDRLCYSGFNSNGTVRGNCGPAATPRQFRRCEPEHVMCGTLQCQLGDMRPLAAPAESQPTTDDTRSQVEFSKKIIHGQDGQHHECKVVTGQTAPAAASFSLSYVLDGTRCAPGKVCFNRTCQQVASVYRDAYELCPRDERGRHCSGNGLCSTANRCQCDEHWTGHDCSQRASPPTELPPPSPPTEPPSRSIELLKVEEQSRPVAATSASPAPAETTEAPVAPQTTAASSTTQAPPAPVSSSSSNVVLDKKKHDAMGAPTLVFILVSIVAAVYLGFALMANCYRRKGFIKPDKVLRHHQMNCKLDALRSSFIAKRLADAQAAGSIVNLAEPLDGSQGQLSGDLMSAFLAPSLQQAAACQHLGAIYSPAGAEGPTLGGYEPEGTMLKSRFARAYDEQSAAQQQVSGRQLAASVHYFDEPSQLSARDCIHQRRHPPAGQMCNTGDSFERLLDQGADHIPLLEAAAAEKQPPSRWGPRPAGQPAMSSFRQPPARHRAYKPADGTWQFPARPLPACLALGKASRISARQPLINRATSLGSVHQKPAAGRRHYDDANHLEEAGSLLEADEDAGRAHRALATPLRSSGQQRTRPAYYPAQRRHQTEPLDSCSAPSSPDHRDPWASEPEEQQVYQPTPALSRHTSVSRLGARQSSRSFQSKDDVEDDLPPLPPPPLEPDDELARLAVDGQGADTDETEDESERAPSTRHQAASRQQSGGPKWSTSRSVHRVPLAGGEAASKIQLEQLSLIAQLQQLEHVQSLHQKLRHADQGQKGSKQATGSESLHEFFSLPLSVQLSALLARTFAPDQRADSMAVDDYLNLLNNTNVAASSRRNFKRPGQSKPDPPPPPTSQQQQRKQQVKLQNLQGLIDRLQKLQQQTVLQQQLEELGAADQYLPAGDQHSRTSTLSRPRSRMRFEQANEDPLTGSARTLADTETLPARSTAAAGQSSTRSLRRSSSRSTREQTGKNESVFSMSDSEDGAYVSRLLVATYQNLQTRRPTESRQQLTPVNSQQQQQQLLQSQETNVASHHQSQGPNLTRGESSGNQAQDALHAPESKKEPSSNSTFATSSVSGSSSASSPSTTANETQQCNNNQ